MTREYPGFRASGVRCEVRFRTCGGVSQQIYTPLPEGVSPLSLFPDVIRLPS